MSKLRKQNVEQKLTVMMRMMKTAALTDIDTASTRVLTECWTAAGAVTNCAGRLTIGGNSVTSTASSTNKYKTRISQISSQTSHTSGFFLSQVQSITLSPSF